jgi:hypothetical protein
MGAPIPGERQKLGVDPQQLGGGFLKAQRCCNFPRNWSFLAAMTCMSSSVTLPNFSRTDPFIRFHLPSTSFQSMMLKTSTGS